VTRSIAPARENGKKNERKQRIERKTRKEKEDVI
jgi:hypothetical protein